MTITIPAIDESIEVRCDGLLFYSLVQMVRKLMCQSTTILVNYQSFQVHMIVLFNICDDHSRIKNDCGLLAIPISKVNI